MNLTDDDDGSYWRSTNSASSFTVELGKPVTFTTMRISPRDKATSARFEVREAGAWKTLLDNLTLHRDENLFTFPPTTGDAVRFSFTDDQKHPELFDFELYPEL